MFRFIRYLTKFDDKSLISEELSVWNQDGLFVSLISNETGDNGRGICRFIDLESYFERVNSRVLDQPENKYTNEDQSVFTKSYGILSRGQGTIAFKIGDQIYDFVKRIKIMSVSRIATHRLASKEDYELASDGSNLVTVLNAIINHGDNFPEITQWFQKVIGEQSSKVRAPPVESHVTARLTERGLTSFTDLANMSKSIEQILISLLMFENLKDSMICIEEPEAHIHPSAQKRIFEYFKKKSIDNQILMTTHSSIFTSLENNTKLYLINKHEAMSDCLSIDKANELVLVRKSLGINNSDAYGADSVIFLEGPNDVSSFEKFALLLGFNLVGHNIIVDSVCGTDYSPNLMFLARYMKKSQCNIFAILDNHIKNVKTKDSLVSESLVNPEDIIIRSKQFENLFESEAIIQCMNEIANEYEFSFELTADDLDVKRKESDSDVISILREITNDKVDDYKTKLSEKLVDYTIQQIVNDKDGTRERSDFEMEVNQIMERVAKKGM